jgi:predicted DNA-binding transcriptional regulator AlpA
MNTLMNERQAGDWLGVSVRTLQRWRLEGVGPRFRKLGRLVRYHQSDLEEFVTNSTRTSTSDLIG